MMNTFNIGDLVIAKSSLGGKVYGKGEVVEYDPFSSLPYTVRIHEDQPFPGTFEFGENELTPVTPVPPSKKPVAYISGCITSKPDTYRERFREVAEIIAAMGYEVLNPVELDDAEGVGLGDAPHEYFMRRDLRLILERADVVIVFDDWKNSAGATDEAYVAKVCGIPVKRLAFDGPFTLTFTNSAGETVSVKGVRLVDDVDFPVAMEGKQIVLGARRSTYGHPLDNWLHIANMMNACIAHKLKPGERFDVRDVMAVMQLTKLSREYKVHKRDNAVDGVGYWYAYDECIEEAERRGIPVDSILTGDMFQEGVVD